MVTWLRIIVSCFCLVLCILLAALWVCSYQTPGNVAKQPVLIDHNMLLGFTNAFGYVSIWYDGDGRSVPWRWKKLNIRSMENVNDYVGIRSLKFGWGVTGPHWFFMLIAAILAVVSRPAPRWRFGMRELLVISTIGAVVVGTTAAVFRAIG
jgi:hypothetical protein